MTPTVRRVDYRAPADRAALIALLGAYAQDPMGGGSPLPHEVKTSLCDDLAAHPLAVSFIAWVDDAPVGLVNAFEGYSTFMASPLLNVHDLAVLPAHRAHGIGQALLAACEAHARERGCCKLTLEVLSGNRRALRSYERFGFAPYTLDPREGQALQHGTWPKAAPGQRLPQRSQRGLGLDQCLQCHGLAGQTGAGGLHVRAYSAGPTGRQLQKRLRSPYTLSTRPTGDQYLLLRSAATG